MLEESSCGSCQYRADGKCIGGDKCLHESDDWIQQRVLAKLNFSQSKSASSSTNAKAAHNFFHTLKLSEGLGSDREAFLDNLINARKKCSFEKVAKKLGVLERLPDETNNSSAN